MAKHRFYHGSQLDGMASGSKEQTKLRHQHTSKNKLNHVCLLWCCCALQTAPLFECMAKHRFYYGSQLDGMASRSKDREQDTAASSTEHEQQTSSSVNQQQQQPQQQQHMAAAGDGGTLQNTGSSSSSSRAAGSKGTGEAAQLGGQAPAAGAAGLAAL
jgi:hypothetical protein